LAIAHLYMNSKFVSSTINSYFGLRCHGSLKR
jgi:hypothetical protein